MVVFTRISSHFRREGSRLPWAAHRLNWNIGHEGLAIEIETFMIHGLGCIIAIATLLFLGACVAPRRINMGTSSSPACSLSPEQLQQRRQALIPGLLKRANQVTELEDGFRLRFAYRDGLLTELARVIEQEQTCCGFLRFRLSVEPSAGPITLEVTGPAGTVQMLRSL